MKKRIISLILVLAMVSGTITIIAPLTAMAAPACYQQGDSRWGGISYGNWNLAESGCGILSTVNAVNYLTGNFIPPTELAAWGYNNGYYNGVYGQGTVRATFYANVTAAFGSKYGFEVTNLTWGNIYNAAIKNHLINGGAVIVHVPNHFMAITAYDSSTAKFLVYDSSAAPKRNTSTLGSWLTADQINGNSLTKVDWFCLVTRTGNAPVIDTTLYTTNAVVAGGSGSVHFGNNITTAQVAAGTIVNYQTTPASEYKVSQILVGGTSVPIQNNGEDYVYQFTMPSGNCDVVVTFSKIATEVASGYYNTFDMSTPSVSVHNGKVTATAIYTQGTQDLIDINGWSVNTAGTKSFYYTVDGGAATELAKKQRLDVLLSGTYSLFADYCDSVNIGFEDTFNPSGLSVGTHTIDVYARDNAGASYEVGTITLSVKSSATLLYTTNAIVASGLGMVHFGNNITTTQVVAGTIVNYQTTPASGYKVSQILVGGTSIDIQNNGMDCVYQFTMPSCNCDVVVTFAEDNSASDYYNTFDMSTPPVTVHNDKVTATVEYTQGSTDLIDIDGWSVNVAGTKSFYYTVDGGAATELSKIQRLDVLLSDQYGYFVNYCDSVNIGFSDTYDPSGLSAGVHTIDIYARDNAGTPYEVGTITVTVTDDRWEFNNATNVTTGIEAGKTALVIRTGKTAPSESVEAAYFETEYGANGEKVYEIDFSVTEGTEFGVMGVSGLWQSKPGQTRMFFATMVAGGDLRTASGDDTYGDADTGVDVAANVVHNLKMVSYNDSSSGTDYYFDGVLVGHSNASANPDRLIFRVGGANAEVKIYRVAKSIANNPSTDKEYRYYSETFDDVSTIQELEARVFGPSEYPGGWTISELTNGHTVTIEKQDTETNYIKMRRTGEGDDNASLVYTMPSGNELPADLSVTFMYDGAGQSEFRFVDGDNWLCKMFIQDGQLYWGDSASDYTGEVLKDWLAPFTEHTLTLRVGDGKVKIFLDDEYLGEKAPFTSGFGTGLPKTLRFYSLAKSITDSTYAQKHLFTGLALKSVTVGPIITATEDYREQLLEKGFPESYIPMLLSLHDKHPNWEFNALNITQTNNSGYTWEYVIAQMLAVPARNLMVKSDWAPKPFEALGDANYAPYRDESLGTFDSGSFYAITPEATEYFMDPRNFLNEVECFMFLDWNYSGESITKDQVETVLKGSVFANTVIPDLDGETTYAEYIVNVCMEIGINPLFVSSRLVQENGAGSPMVDGTTGDVLGNSKLNGLYNFFNIQAGGTGDTEIYTNGMNEAMNGTPAMASAWGGNGTWNTRWKAIYGGILKLRDNYVNVYKNTLYMQKFNTDPRGVNTFSGYMQNVCAPIFESRKMQESVSAFGLLDNEFTFTIPVYDGMPAKPCADPGQGVTRCSYSVEPVTEYSAPYVNTYDANGGYAPQMNRPIEVTYDINYGALVPISITGWSVHKNGINGYFYIVNENGIRNMLSFVTRTDVLDVYSEYEPYCPAEKIGYTGTFDPSALAVGSHEICVYGINDNGDIYKSAVLTINVKESGLSEYINFVDDMNIDSTGVGSSVDVEIDINALGMSNSQIRGWSLSTRGIKSYYYTVDGGSERVALDFEKREDVLSNSAYLDYADYISSENVGFTGMFDATTLEPGSHTINVYALDNNNNSYGVAAYNINVPAALRTFKPINEGVEYQVELFGNNPENVSVYIARYNYIDGKKLLTEIKSITGANRMSGWVDLSNGTGDYYRVFCVDKDIQPLIKQD